MGPAARVWLVVTTVAAIAVLSVGVGVFVFGGDRPQRVVQTQTAVNDESETAVTAPVTAAQEQADAEAEYDAFMAWLEEEAAKEEEVEAAVEEQPQAAEPVAEAAANVQETPNLFAMAGAESAGENMPRWRAIWADLSLTAEEQARLREGFGLAMTRWMGMSQEQQAAERARLQQMRVRWEGMNDDERAAASQRMRDRFEEWRASGRAELPELTLD